MSRSSSDPISSDTMSADGGVTSAPAKAMRIRSTAIATQMHCKAAFQKKKEDSIAFKHAIIVFCLSQWR